MGRPYGTIWVTGRLDRTRLMNLQPVDFKAVAAKGCFVYCYLREHDLTPYYVGFASEGRYVRPLEDHGSKTPLPKFDALIRVLRYGLTEKQAFDWEIRYIKRYGRKMEGGLLLNRSTGGEAPAKGARYKRTAADVEAKANQLRGMTRTEEQRQAISELAQKRVNDGQMWFQSEEGRQKVSEQFKGVEKSKEHVAKVVASNHITFSERFSKRFGIPYEASVAMSGEDRRAFRDWMRTDPKNNWALWVLLSAEGPHNRRFRSNRYKTAVKYGINPVSYLSLEETERAVIRKRFCRGKRGAELLAGITAA